MIELILVLPQWRTCSYLVMVTLLDLSYFTLSEFKVADNFIKKVAQIIGRFPSGLCVHFVFLCQLVCPGDVPVEIYRKDDL